MIMARECSNPAFDAGITAMSQESRTIHFDDATLRQFDLAFAKLAKESGVPFVLEGTPYRLQLTDDQLNQVKKNLLLKGSSVDSTVAVVAEAYDYEVVRSKGNGYVLQKRYSSPDDLPSISLEETAHNLRLLEKEMKPFFFEEDRSVIFSTLRSDTPTELQNKLHMGTTIDTLPTSMQKLLFVVATAPGNHSYSYLIKILPLLSESSKGLSIFHRYQNNKLYITSHKGQFYARNTNISVNVPMIWYLNPDVSLFEIDNRTSSLRMELQRVGVDRDINVSVGSIEQKDKAIPAQPEPTTPTEKDFLPRLPSVHRTTLGQLCDKWNVKLAPAGNGVKPDAKNKTGLTVNHIDVDVALRDKTVCVFGDEKTDVVTEISLAAAAYDLHPLYANGIITLALPAPRLLDNYGEISLEARRLLPSPFRAILLAARERNKFDEHRSTRELTIPALRRLRTIVEPLIAKAADGQVPITDVGAEARGLVAYTTLLGGVSEFNDLQQPTPSYLTNFSKATVSIRFLPWNKDGRTKVEYDFQYKSPTTGETSGFGGTIVGLPPP